jgi:hypothetical protein
MWLLLYHVSWTNGRNTSIFMLFQDSLTMNYTPSRLGLPIRGITNYKISSPGQWHCECTIHVAPLVSWLMDKWKGSFYFYTLSRQFDHELHLIWAEPPTKKCHYNEVNINTRTVTLLTHNSCGSSCIMAHGQMEGIHLFLYSFKTFWPWITFNLSLATYQEVSWKKRKCQHQDSDIASTQFMWPLLYHGSWTNGRDPYLFILFQDSLTMNYTTVKLGLPIRGIRNYKISSPGQWHCKCTIHVAPLVSWLMEKWKGSIYFYTLSRQFDHELHYFKVGITHKRH